MNLVIKELTFSGSLLSWLLELFKGYISKLLTTEIENIVCQDVLAELVNVKATNMIHQINKEMEPYLTPAPSLDPVIPPDIHVVDWRKATGLNAITGLVNRLLGGGTVINCMMDELTNGTGTVKIGNATTTLLHFEIPVGEVATIAITLHSIDIRGVDTIDSLLLFNVSEATKGSHTNYLNSAFGMENLGFDIMLDVATTLNTSTTLMENFTLSVNMSEVLLNNSWLLGFQTDILSHLYMGHDTFICLVDSLWSANMTEIGCFMDIDAITFSPEDPEYLEKDIDQMINTVLQLLTTSYRPLLRAFVEGIASGPIRNAINTLLTGLIALIQFDVGRKNPNPCLPPIAPNMSAPNWIDWQNAPVLHTIATFLNEDIGADGVNRLVSCALKSADLNKTWEVDSHGFHADMRLAELQGVDSFYDFALLEAASPFVINNTIGIAQCDNSSLSVCDPLLIGLEINIAFRKLNLTINFTTEAQNLEILAAVLMQLDRNRLDTLPLSQVLRSSCLLTCAEALQLKSVGIGVQHLIVDFAVTGTSEFNFSLQGSKFDQGVDAFLKAMTGGMTRLFNVKAGEEKIEAPYNCIEAPMPQPAPPADPLVYVEIAALALGGMLVLGLFIMAQRNPAKVMWYFKCGCCRAKTSFEESLMNVAGGRPRIPSKEGDPIDWRDSMLFNSAIPLWVRISIPMMLAINIAIFVAGNLKTGAGVSAQIKQGDKTFDLGELAEFTLQNSVHDMWQAGVYPLSILIALFSGGWPYMKLVLMGSCWCIPIQILNLRRRENLLMWLDALGKWSLIDTYVLVIFLVSFRFHIAEFQGAFVMDIFVTPEAGFYLFLIATMLSLAMGHIILAFHRFSVPDYISVPEGGDRLALRTQSLSINYKNRGMRAVRFTRYGQILVTGLLAICLGNLVYGSYVHSFSFEFTGLAGMALGPAKISYWSVDRLGANIPNSAKDPSTFGVHWIQAVFFLFTSGMPIAYLLTSIFLWLTPLTIKRQRQTFVVTEVFYAWSALEVFIVSVLAALTEISQFAEFTVGSKCDPLLPILEFFGDNDGCFGLKTVLLSGCWVLFGSGLIFVFVGQTVCAICHSVLHHRLSQLNPKQPNEEDYDPGANKSNCCTSVCVSLAIRLHLVAWDYLSTASALQDQEGVVSTAPPAHEE